MMEQAQVTVVVDDVLQLPDIPVVELVQIPPPVEIVEPEPEPEPEIIEEVVIEETVQEENYCGRNCRGSCS